MQSTARTFSGLPRIETVGQYSRDYGATVRVLERDADSNVIRSLGGLSETDAETLSHEWAAEHGIE